MPTQSSIRISNTNSYPQRGRAGWKLHIPEVESRKSELAQPGRGRATLWRKPNRNQRLSQFEVPASSTRNGVCGTLLLQPRGSGRLRQSDYAYDRLHRLQHQDQHRRLRCDRRWSSMSYQADGAVRRIRVIVSHEYQYAHKGAVVSTTVAFFSSPRAPNHERGTVRLAAHDAEVWLSNNEVFRAQVVLHCRI